MVRQVLLLTFVLALSGYAALGSGPAPVYVCWCGKNQPAPAEDPIPVDAWDAACKQHDLCYRRRGRDHPQCDIAFIQRLEAIALRQGYGVDPFPWTVHRLAFKESASPATSSASRFMRTSNSKSKSQKRSTPSAPNPSPALVSSSALSHAAGHFPQPPAVCQSGIPESLPAHSVA